MASFDFENVKAEKEDALWRYNMEKKLKLGLRLTGFLLVLFLFSWSWFPTLIPDTVEVAGGFGHRFVSAFNEPLFTFVLVNIIILVVYILSSQKQTQKIQTTSPDIYDEYVSSRRSISTSAVGVAADPAMEENVVDKQIVLVENAAPLSPVKQLQTTVDNSNKVRETNISLSSVKQPTTIRTVLTETKTKTKRADFSTEVINQKENLRTRSMDSESRNQKPPRRDFRRSETAISRELQAISGIEPPRKSMDDLSSEEFQSLVESFIAEGKKTLLQENTAHYTRRKGKCMSIIVKN